jgi:hyperosmotically inducible periplasmic protein
MMNIKTVVALLLAFVLFAACLPAKPKDLSDDAVTNMVRRKLASDADVKGGMLQVDVKNGVVTLSGSVDRDKQKQRAEKLAKKVAGVKQVVNKITVRMPGR